MALKKVFITGESGYICSSMIAQLHQAGYEVVNAHDNEDKKDLILAENATLKNGKLYRAIENREPEINIENKEFLFKAFEELQPDIVIHSAAYVGSDACDLDPLGCIKSNVYGTHNVIEACKKFDCRLVYFGTTSVFGGNGYATDKFEEYKDHRFNEDTMIDPKTLYGITKLDSELQVINLFGMQKTMILRPVYAFGDYPHDKSSAIVKIMHNGFFNSKNKDKKQLKMRLHPKYWKDYMRVEDLASAVVHLIKGQYWGEDFNIARGEPHRMGDIYDQIVESYPGEYDVEFLSHLDYHTNHLADTTKLLSTGWKPKIDLMKGMDMAYKSIKVNPDVKPVWKTSEKLNER